MKRVLFVMIAVLSFNASAVDNVVDTTAATKTLENYVFNQIMVRTGLNVDKASVDPKESDVSIVRNIKKQETADKANLTAEQTMSTSDGNLVIKPDIIHQVNIDGTYFFGPSVAPKEGVACLVGANIEVSTVYKNPSKCAISIQCTWLDGSQKDVMYSVKQTDCGVFTPKADERARAEEPHAARIER